MQRSQVNNGQLDNANCKRFVNKQLVTRKTTKRLDKISEYLGAQYK